MATEVFRKQKFLPKKHQLRTLKPLILTKTAIRMCFFSMKLTPFSFYSNERGGLFVKKEFPHGKSPTAMEIADINGDGQLDFIQLLKQRKYFCLRLLKTINGKLLEYNLTNKKLLSGKFNFARF